jgi:hypothetical protein
VFIRVAPQLAGRLVKVRLSDVEQHRRAMSARRLRDKRWNEELRPDFGYSPTMSQRLRALTDAVELERAVIAPSERQYLVPEKNVQDVLG